MKGCARGNTRHDTFHSRESSRTFECVLIGDREDFVQDGAVQHGGNKTDADAGHEVAPSGSARKYSGPSGLNGDDAHARLALLEDFPDSGDGSTSANASNEDIDRARSIVPDLHGRGSPVYFGVRWISKLVQHDCTWNFFEELRGPCDGITHEDSRGEHDFCAEVPE
jgi:hypothetical protein